MSPNDTSDANTKTQSSTLTGEGHHEFHELLHLQSTIRQFKLTQEKTISGGVYRANLIMQKVALILLSILISTELITAHSITRHLTENSEYLNKKIHALILIALFLIAALFFAYKTLKESASRSGHRTQDFINQSFKSFAQYKHYTDLLIKFTILSAIIIGDRGQWVAPALLLFTADYLLQLRYFVFSHRTSLIFGAITLALACTQFYLQNPFVIWPMLWFATITVASIYTLRNLKKIPDLDKDAV